MCSLGVISSNHIAIFDADFRCNVTDYHDIYIANRIWISKTVGVNGGCMYIVVVCVFFSNDRVTVLTFRPECFAENIGEII